MTYDMIDAALVFLIYFVPFCLLLCIGGFFADYVLPRCPKLEAFLFRMMGVDPDELYEEDYEED